VYLLRHGKKTFLLLLEPFFFPPFNTTYFLFLPNSPVLTD
jgi:hypothetical protein